MIRRTLPFLSLLLAGALALAQLAVPPLRERVTDLTGTLDAVQVGPLVFSVMLARGGAVRWFKVTRAPPAEADA